MLRDYSQRNGLHYKLGMDEFNFPNCHLRMGSILEELVTLEGIVTCSLFILPDDHDDRMEVFRRIVEARAELHCVMENQIVRDWDSARKAEEILSINDTLHHCPSVIPALASDDISVSFTHQIG